MIKIDNKLLDGINKIRKSKSDDVYDEIAIALDSCEDSYVRGYLARYLEEASGALDGKELVDDLYWFLKNHIES